MYKLMGLNLLDEEGGCNFVNIGLHVLQDIAFEGIQTTLVQPNTVRTQN